MGKSTLVMISLAALGLGALVGVSLVDRPAEQPTIQPADQAPVQPAESAPTTPATAVALDTGGAPVFRYLGAGDVVLKQDDFGQPLPATLGENHIAREGEWKSETVEVVLEALGKVEYKVLMRQGDTIVYNWSTDGGVTYYDLHAHDPAFGDQAFTRYEEGEGKTSAGAIVAPYDGQHGWFWLNTEDKPMTISLKVAGFYDEIKKIELQGY